MRRQRQANVQTTPGAPFGRAQHRAGGLDLIGLGCHQCDPQAAVDGLCRDVHRHGLTTTGHGRKDLMRDIALRQLAELIEVLQLAEQGGRTGLLAGAEPTLDEAAPLHRQHGERVFGLKSGRAIKQAASLDLHGRGTLGAQGHDAAAGHRRTQLAPHQREKGQALALGDEVGAVQHRVSQPGKELDQGDPWVAHAGLRPLGRVRRDARQHLIDQVLVAAVVNDRELDGHLEPSTQD